jgi:hypothetical protein
MKKYYCFFNSKNKHRSYGQKGQDTMRLFLHSELIGDSLQMKDGYVLPPEKPGLGITLTEDTIRRFPFIRGTGEFNSVPGKILNH